MKPYLYIPLILLIALVSCKKSSTSAPLYQNSLTVDDGTWYVNSNSYGDWWGYTSVGNNSFYYITNYQSNEHLYSLAPYNPITSAYNVQVTATINHLDSGVAGAGIIFNYQDSNDFAYVSVRSDANFRIWQHTAGVLDSLCPLTPCAAINATGTANIIKVVQTQDSMKLVINNVQAYSTALALLSYTTTGTLKAGVTAITTGSPTFTPVTVDFNNFSISKD